MSRVRIKQVRSSIDRSQKQKRTLKALGLNKINGTVDHDLNDTIRGMIFKVSHLVQVEELDDVQDSGKVNKAKAEVKKDVVVPPVAVVEEEE